MHTLCVKIRKSGNWAKKRSTSLRIRTNEIL
jgi:hypothetical protein